MTNYRTKTAARGSLSGLVEVAGSIKAKPSMVKLCPRRVVPGAQSAAHEP